MKTSILVFLIFLLFVACEDVLDLDLPVSESRLVIDALIGYNSNIGGPAITGQVKLTLTTPFFDQNIPTVVDATVIVIDEMTGFSYQLIESEPGVFATGFPDLKFDRDYTLIIHYNNEVYTATQRLQKSPVIDGLEQRDGFLFNGKNETEVAVSFTDLPDEPSYYLFAFGWDNFLVVEDEFFQDSDLTFSYFYDNLKPGKQISVTLFGIDKEFANYAKQALTQSGVTAGSPFTIPVARLRGNLVNSTNPDNYPFGYFALSEFDSQSLTIE